MSSVFIVFPHQLFKDLSPFKKADKIVMIEEELFFTQYAFHEKKIAYHKDTMQAYVQLLVKKGFDVAYIESHDKRSPVKQMIASLKKEGVEIIHLYHVHDNWLEKRIIGASADHNIELIWHASPMFMLKQEEIEKEFSGKKSFFQTTFYIQQRKRFSILVNENMEPVGGKWSFDADNRKPYPKNKKPPVVHQSFYPVTHAEAEVWLDDFLQQRFAEFGLYEDAMVAQENVLHHSVLTPMLNIGLLTPKQVLDRVISFSQGHEIPMNSLEGFVRQVLGWREFIRGIYYAVGSKQRTTNYWGFKRKIPSSFYTGNTGIVPVDNAIQKLLKTGYNHHIERLMILSNFMLLCEFDPDEVYRWFMEMYIDAYDWVMVPNVYGMGQFADGGLMCTKPYISGSNYILKMSDYKKVGNWTEIWDGLFWRFMHVHRNFFLSNPRIGMLVRTFDKMPYEKRKMHLLNAEKFLDTLDRT